MNADNRHDELDALLDASLQNYSRVEPPPGLEQRIQAGLEAAVRRAPHLAWSGWLLPAGAAVLAFVALLYFSLRTAAPPPSPPAQVAESPTVAPPAAVPVAPEIPAPSVRASRRAAAVTVQQATLPRRREFPSPAPLSEQERLLLAYVGAARPQAASSRKGDTFAVLTVEPLRISPLKFEELERNP